MGKQRLSNISNNEATMNKGGITRTMVPARWLVLTITSCASCFIGVGSMVFLFGDRYSTIVHGQENLVERVSAIETDRAKLSPEFRERITAVETGLKDIKEQNRLILDILRNK